jgi:hypothetical protein
MLVYFVLVWFQLIRGLLSVFLLKAVDRVVENWLSEVRVSSGFGICYTVIRHLKMAKISNHAEKIP